MPRWMRFRWPLFLFTYLAFALSSPPARAGKLDRVSQEARSSGSSSSSSSSSSQSTSYSSSDCCSSGDAGDDNAAFLVVAALTSPWWIPIKALESDRPTLAAGYLGHPYESGSNGQLVIAQGPSAEETLQDTDSSGEDTASTVPQKGWALQLGAESGYVFDRVWRHGLSLRLQTVYRIEFDAYWSLFMEREYGAVDNLAIGREHLIWRFAQSNSVQFRTSFGAQHVIDKYGDLSGVDVAYGLDIFPGRPIALSLEGAVGNLGSAFAPRVRATLGFVADRFELLVGYDHQWIGREDLGGPFAGVRVWL